MVNKRMYELGEKRSAIRELFEYGKHRAQELGADKVYDFSLGNPSVPAPKEIGETLKSLIDQMDGTALHGYTSAQGDLNARKAIADDLNARYDTNIPAEKLYLTCGASASLIVTMSALCESASDEIVILAPYFPEYRIFITTAGAKIVTVPCDDTFQINLAALENALSKNTKAVIVNSPNNPSGVIYSKETLQKLASLLDAHNKKHNATVYIIADEPYRELAYDGIEVPFIPTIYKNTIVCYSYSKSLSLPGERIGYIAVNPDAEHADEIYTAILGAGRAHGYVCAPALFQHLLTKCASTRPILASYAENRKLLHDALTSLGFSCANSDGAFYLFVKAPDGNSVAFSQRAKGLGILIVPGDDFGASGWVRIAYCVDNAMIHRSLPAFKTLAESYNLI